MVEYGDPQSLLKTEGSIFSSLVSANQWQEPTRITKESSSWIIKEQREGKFQFSAKSLIINY